jgi:hypothetical protein
MRTVRTRGTLVARLERLESRAAALRPVKLRFGKLRRLGQEYKGERHVVIAKHLPSQAGQEWVEFEEVPGPDPSSPHDLKIEGPEYNDIVFVAPFPTQACGSER